MSQGNDQELLLWICIPIIVVILIILILDGTGDRWDEIANLIWIIVLMYALFMSVLYGAYQEIQ